MWAHLGNDALQRVLVDALMHMHTTSYSSHSAAPKYVLCSEPGWPVLHPVAYQEDARQKPDAPMLPIGHRVAALLWLDDDGHARTRRGRFLSVR